MKHLFILVALLSSKFYAQSQLNFDKRFVQCEDRWVAFQPDKDSAYTFGFIYIDPEAGLTLNYEGDFKISPTGLFVPKKPDTLNLKVRLKPNNVLVAIIPDNKFKELQIEAIPDWLKYYKKDTNSIDRLYRWGFMYNGWGECAKALTFLEKAKNINPNYKGLPVELAYSYNCLNQFDKAEAILEEEIQANPGDAYVCKEYIYTLTKNKKIEKAILQFESSGKTIKDKQFDAENCYNILEYYYYQKDVESFKKWYRILQNQPNENNMITQYANNMKKNLGIE